MAATETVIIDIRPKRVRVVAWIAAAAILAVFAAVATALTGSTGEGNAVFRPGDQAAMIGLGVCAALGALAFARPRVWGTEQGIRVRNVFGTYDLPWNVVRSVRFEHGHPWAQLELQDDDTLSVLAIQAVDKEHAVAAIRGLRSLHAAHVTAHGGTPDSRA
ncbi:PH domain-containing protein [Hamadaea sp.]|uniref:PH domain-containing protein n=1 Tax=Hamadaea sp. TaxID=2024425 RepID=UPI0025B7B626|nr:PH domain-containing protein [Hamadaea sp.]